MATGRQTLTQMEDALAVLRREESAVSDRLAQLTDKIGLSRADEADAFGDLARFKLTAGGAGIADRLDRASRDARAAIERRDIAMRSLDNDRNARAAAVAAADRDLSARRSELDVLEHRIEALSPQVDAALAADPAHVALAAASAAAERTEEAAAKKADQADADLAGKGKAYEADPLFTYLWRRKFGTSEYASTGLTRFLDRWVANLIGYHEARAAYAVLTEIPVRLRAHAARVTEEADAAEAALAVSEVKMLARIAGEDLAGMADALEAKIAALEAKTVPQRAELQALVDRAAVFARGEDDELRVASEHLVKSMAGDDLSALRREALRTPSPEDERMVARIEAARVEIGKLEAEAAGLGKQLEVVGQRRADLNSVTTDFRNRGWERGSNFEIADFLGSVLGGFLGGVLSRGDFWGRLEGGRRGDSGSSWGGSWGGGSSSGGRSGGFRLPGGGGRSGGFRTGGRIGGGGFKTGRRF